MQIQNRGTIGGNIANASPAGDTLPVLAAADAVVVLAERARRAPRAVQRVLHRATAKTVRRARRADRRRRDPAAAEGSQWFRKVGTRAAQAISKVVMAGGARRDRPRIAIGSVAPTRRAAARGPKRRSPSGAIDRRGAARRARREITPIDDVRSTADYRRRVAANLLARWWSTSENVQHVAKM